MAIDLSPELITAQASLEREPIIEITSGKFLPGIPFDGSLLNPASTDDSKPRITILSSGELFGVYINDGDIFLVLTDSEKVVWNQIDTTINGLWADIVELDNGNVGVYVVRDNGSTRSMLFSEMSPTGTIVTPVTTLFTFNDPAEMLEYIAVERISTGEFLMVYSTFTDPNYTVSYRLSSDGVVWGAAATIPMTDLNTTRAKRNFDLLATSQDGILLFFEYVDQLKEDGSEVTNIHYTQGSADATVWNTPVRITDYTAFGISAIYPTAAEKSTGEIVVGYTESSDALRMGADTDGWCSNTDNYWCGYGFVTAIHYDAPTQLLYVTSSYSGGGTKALCGVEVIDITTWTIVRCYSTKTSPAFHSVYDSVHMYPENYHSEGHFVVVANATTGMISLVDDSSETITQFTFEDNATWGTTQNVDHGVQHGSIYKVWLDSTNQKLYVLFRETYLYTASHTVGYIDLTQTPGMDNWQFTMLLDYEKWDQFEFYGGTHFIVVPEIDSFFISGISHSSFSVYGRMKRYSLTTGNVISNWCHDTEGSFPYRSMAALVYSNGKIYGSFVYANYAGEENKRGLACLDLATDSVSYYRPTWATVDDYGLGKKVLMPDGRILIATTSGAAIFNPQDWTWELENNDTIPGFSSDGGDSVQVIEYVEDIESIVVGREAASGGITMFSTYGSYFQGKYLEASYSGTWDFGVTQDLTIGILETEIDIVTDSEDNLWSVWSTIDQESRNTSLKWDNSETEKDLGSVLRTDQGVSLHWAFGTLATLTFSCSDGPLFDINNTYSSWSNILKRGRKIFVRIGEKIDSVEHWVNQGTFIVTETTLKYKRGTYPDIQVSCEDMSSMYEFSHVVASDYYADSYPEYVIQDLLEKHGNVDATFISIDEFDTRHVIDFQFIENTLGDVISELLDHFGYFHFWNVDGEYSPRKVDFTKAVDFICADNSMIDFNQDTTFSTFTNHVLVTGESKDLLEVLHPEELVGQVAGTMGWWGGTERKTVYYSEDHERVCRDPRLDVLTSTGDFRLFVFKGGGGEEITYEDPDGKYLELTMEGPNCMGIIAANIALLIVAGKTAVGCDTGRYCGSAIFATNTLLTTLLYSLSAVANYQIDVYAKPMGEERQTIQGEDDDTELQQELNGAIITEKVDDPYCYTVQECNRVAKYSMDMIKAQRKRLGWSMVTNLSNELGDMVRVNHVHTGLPMDVLITELTRTYIKPPNGNDQSGGVIDVISGWRNI